jgi:hypothetical protein
MSDASTGWHHADHLASNIIDITPLYSNHGGLRRGYELAIPDGGTLKEVSAVVVFRRHFWTGRISSSSYGACFHGTGVCLTMQHFLPAHI